MQHLDWQKLWLEQSKIFMEITDKTLRDLGRGNAKFKPQDHMQQMQQWAELMNQQWQEMVKSCSNADHVRYWEAVAETSKQACELMMQQWQDKVKADQPMQSAKDLYEMWLNACHQVQMQNMNSSNFQNLYGDMLNNAMQFWKSTLNK